MKKIVALLSAVMMLFTQISVSAEILFSDTVENPNLHYPVDPTTIPVNGTLIVEFEDMTDYDKSIVSVKAKDGASGGKILSIDAPDHNLADADNAWMNTMGTPDIKYVCPYAFSESRSSSETCQTKNSTEDGKQYIHIT